MSSASASNLFNTHLRLKPDARADQLPVDANFWPDLMAGKFGNFHNEYLVTSFTYDQAWPSWEIHPNGDEIVILLSGAADFILETSAGNQIVAVRNPGDFAFVPKGTWHTATPLEKATMLFITAGEGTYNRPR
jgi:mannose-6-phosphate isomerase-like protein (cupin superfamily)